MWNQVYEPLNGIWISASVAILPILLFIVLLALFKVKGWLAGVISAIFAGIVAVGVYGMPVSKVAWTGAYGVLAGIYPVATIVLTAIFLYKLSVKSGKSSKNR